jgi:signal transduction histidine kinase
MGTLEPLDYRAIVEQTPCAYLFLKPDMPDYTILGVNEAYLKATMTKKEEIIGKKIFEIFPDNPSEQGATSVRNLRESLDLVVKNRAPHHMAVQKYDIRRPNGEWEERWWSPINLPVFVSDRSMICIIHHVVDVTRFFQLQKSEELVARLSEEGKQKLEHIEAQVYERGQEIQNVNWQLQQARESMSKLYKECQKTGMELKRSNMELEQFAYFVSHDLQEPLRAVVGFLTFLKRDLAGSLNENALEDVNEAVAGTQRMQRIILDLLTYSRVSTRGAELKPVNMKNVIGNVTGNLYSAIKESDARIIVETLPTVAADETQMILLFQNLIGNAIKFRGQKQPQIRVWAEHEDRQWVFGVADNGIGIAPENYDTIFQIFQRLFSREEYPGTGIGLAVCKRIVQRHGGRIWVESKMGEGSTFFFTIPDRDEEG